MQIINKEERRKREKRLRKFNRFRANYYYLYEMVGSQKKIKYSQVRKPYHFLFSFHKETGSINEVSVKLWIDGEKTPHGIAPYDDNLIYLQALNIFEASAKFREFVDAHMQLEEKRKHENEKKQIESAALLQKAQGMQQRPLMGDHDR